MCLRRIWNTKTEIRQKKSNAGQRPGFIAAAGKLTQPVHGAGVFNAQKFLSKFGKLHTRTPLGKKYNYCGPGTKLKERLASSDPSYREPINKLDAICRTHDIDYGLAKDLADKHKADDKMLRSISKIPWSERPWGTAAVKGIIGAKRKLGLGPNYLNAISRRIGQWT